MWVLTKEYNDYDQYGEYFVAVWDHNPSVKELERLDLFSQEEIVHIIKGGGRTWKYENEWFHLKEVGEGILYHR